MVRHCGLANFSRAIWSVIFMVLHFSPIVFFRDLLFSSPANLETSFLLLKMQTFIIVYNVVFILAL